MDPVRNPFAPGAGSPPPELAGRQNIIESAEVAQKLADGLALAEFERCTMSRRRACVQVGTSGAGAPSASSHCRLFKKSRAWAICWAYLPSPLASANANRAAWPSDRCTPPPARMSSRTIAPRMMLRFIIFGSFCYSRVVFLAKAPRRKGKFFTSLRLCAFA